MPGSNQLDDALYAYYTTANGFPDSGTLRLDEPDYTNIEGGLGVFAMSSQTVALADTSGNPTANPRQAVAHKVTEKTCRASPIRLALRGHPQFLSSGAGDHSTAKGSVLVSTMMHYRCFVTDTQ